MMMFSVISSDEAGLIQRKLHDNNTAIDSPEKVSKSKGCTGRIRTDDMDENKTQKKLMMRSS
jgi:hypothetical protein